MRYQCSIHSKDFFLAIEPFFLYFLNLEKLPQNIFLNFSINSNTNQKEFIISCPNCSFASSLPISHVLQNETFKSIHFDFKAFIKGLYSFIRTLPDTDFILSTSTSQFKNAKEIPYINFNFSEIKFSLKYSLI